MSQSLVKNHLHLVFSTRARTPWLKDHIRPELHAYLAGVFSNLQSPTKVIGGVEDHVHCLFSLSKNLSLANVVEEVKKSSSRWIKESFPDLNQFYWQRGYAAFSVSESNVEAVANYVQRQVEHHHKSTFQEELRALFQKHGVEFDERYVWD